ncbi:bZIP transcription factor 18 [Quercus lobata]|uniref:BZIP domain-containing protein n=1 Tax=Quercus lobata TaxID=97700 RepID=A0A7N2MGQ9_QUELO|nr:bZIP transcription factor 18 [Quercus lobata]
MDHPTPKNPPISQTQQQQPDSDMGLSNPLRAGHHRRAHSEVHFRIPDDLDLGFDGGPSSAAGFDEDDLFCTYMDIEKLGSRPDGHGSVTKPDNAGEEGEAEQSSRTRHRHSNSVDGGALNLMDSIEAKKAMAPDKLAELWTVDPKRAKRILANRQSAARSKERKARYILELERKVQTLQTEATTLSAQLTLFQRDTTGLSTENTELKLRLQAMEQQAQLRDALNEALKKEVERLKIATGEIMTHNDTTYNLGMHHVSYPSSSFFSHQPQPQPGDSQNVQMPSPFHQFQSNTSTAHQPLLAVAHSHAFTDMLQQDPLGRLQGLDISGRGSHMVKPEGTSISVSESSNSF